MRGTMLIFHPHQPRPTVKEFTREMTLDEMKDGIGGGWLEKVPGFSTIPWNGVVMDCVALCDEDGKHKNLMINNAATALWDRALRRSGHPGLITPGGGVADYLVGQVAVLFGDREFMDAL